MPFFDLFKAQTNAFVYGEVVPSCYPHRNAKGYHAEKPFHPADYLLLLERVSAAILVPAKRLYPFETACDCMRTPSEVSGLAHVTS